MVLMDKEILKEALFYNFLGYMKQDAESETKRDEFDFSFTKDKQHIKFSCISTIVSGATCYDEDFQESCHTRLHYFDSSKIIEIINDFVIQDYEFKKYNITSNEQFIEYYDNKIETYSYYIQSSEEKIDEDAYYNHDVVRTMLIPIDELADYLLTFKFVKPLNECIKSFNYISYSENEEILEKLKVVHLYQQLQQNLPENENKVSRHKI